MKDKKTIVLVLFCFFIGLLLFYFTRPYKIKNPGLDGPTYGHRGAFFGKNSEVSRLSAIVQSLVCSQRSLMERMEMEKNKSFQMEKELLAAVERNQGLSQELGQLKADKGITRSVRERIKKIEDNLEGLDVSENKERTLRKKIDMLLRSLSAIEDSIPGLLRENSAYKGQLTDLSERLQSRSNELSALKNEMNQERSDKARIIRELNDVYSDLKSINNYKSNLEEKTKRLEEAVENYKIANSFLSAETEKKDNKLNAALRKQEDLKAQAERVREENARVQEEKRQVQKQMQEQDEKAYLLKKLNKDLEKEIDSFRSELEELNAQRKTMLKAIEEAGRKEEASRKLQAELDGLKLRIEELNRNYASLEEENRNMKEAIGQNSIELGKRADTILTMQDKLAEAQNKLLETQLKYQQIEKESALLREASVSVQLEKEGLKMELGQARAKLEELEGKLKQIGSIFGSAAAEPSLERQKKIGVELIPQSEGGAQR